MSVIAKINKEEVLEKIQEMNDNSIWMNKEMAVLRKKYPNMFIAIFKQKIVGTNPDHKKLIIALKKQFGEIDTVLIEFINGDDHYFII